MRAKKNRQKRKFRQSGMYLIELIVAIACSGLLAITMGACIAGIMNASSGGQNQLIATGLAQELLDRIRDTYTSNGLNGVTGTFPVKIFTTDTISVGTYTFQAQPLLLDTTNFQFQTPSQTSALNFSSQNGGGITAQFLAGPTTSSTIVVITVTWKENTGTRTLTTTNTIANHGVHS